MISDKIELDIDSCLAQLITQKDISERNDHMKKICAYIESLPLAEQQNWIDRLQLSIRKDFDEISMEIGQL